VKNGDFANFHILVREGLKKEKSIEEIANYYGIDLTLATALSLRGKNDDERLTALNLNPKKYTVWNFTSAHDLIGDPNFKGRIPGEIVLNCLYWFTKQGDLVVDPMDWFAPVPPW